MGFIKAALSAGISSFQDSKFKEAITLPEAVPATALAIKGQLLTKDPDGRSRQSNQNTGLLTDGSVVIVPQGYVAHLEAKWSPNKKLFLCGCNLLQEINLAPKIQLSTLATVTNNFLAFVFMVFMMLK